MSSTTEEKPIRFIFDQRPFVLDIKNLGESHNNIVRVYQLDRDGNRKNLVATYEESIINFNYSIIVKSTGLYSKAVLKKMLEPRLPKMMDPDKEFNIIE